MQAVMKGRGAPREASSHLEPDEGCASTRARLLDSDDNGREDFGSPRRAINQWKPGIGPLGGWPDKQNAGGLAENSPSDQKQA